MLHLTKPVLGGILTHMIQVTVHLSRPQVNELNNLSKTLDVSRAELIRQGIREFIERQKAKKTSGNEALYQIRK